MTAGRTAAFFDLDLTLVAANTVWLYVRHLRRAGLTSRRELLRALVMSLRYRLSTLDVDAVVRQAVSSLAGRPEALEDRLCRECFEGSVRARISPRGRQTVEEHRTRGHLLVLLTGSTRYAARPLAEELELPHLVCTELEVRDGQLTGRLAGPACYGEGKARLAEAFSAEHGVDLARSYFYTDSHTDLPMLLRVGHPRVVGPDRRLRREAVARGWPILSFPAA